MNSRWQRFVAWLYFKLRKIANTRGHDSIISNGNGVVIVHRWYVWRRNRFVNLRFDHVLQCGEPAGYRRMNRCITLVLSGNYAEQLTLLGGNVTEINAGVGDVVIQFVEAMPRRIFAVHADCWTISLARR